MCDDGKAGTGAMTAIKAVGRQDEFLTGNTASFFQFVNLQHTQFTKYSTAVQVTSNKSVNWPFNQRVTVSFNPRTMGDLLLNMYIKLVLPDLRPLNAGVYIGTKYLGYSLINRVRLLVDDVNIEAIDADWNVIQDELYRTDEEKTVIDKITKSSTNVYGGELFIPLNFFFSRTHSTTFTADTETRTKYFKPCFLTCALHNQKNIQLILDFNPITQFFTGDKPSIVTLEDMYIVTEEIVLGKAEREYIKNSTQTTTVSTVEREAVTPIAQNQSPFYATLTPTRPVKIMHWFIRNIYFETAIDQYAIDNRFNYSSTSDYYLPINRPVYLNNVSLSAMNYETVRPIVSETALYLNGVQAMGSSTKPTSVRNVQDGSLFYKFLQNFTNDLYSPSKNIYSYSFCLHPKDMQQSGSIDFSRLDASSTRLTGSLFDYNFYDYYQFNTTKLNAGYNLYIFYVGYKRITYQGGRISIG